MYEMKASEYPTTEQGLEALVKKPNDLGDDEWTGPYLKDGVPQDDFKQDFVYRQPGEEGTEYDLFSKGPNKQEGDDDDIYAKKRKTNE
jgi:general secretion pathway protein G